MKQNNQITALRFKTIEELRNEMFPGDGGSLYAGDEIFDELARRIEVTQQPSPHELSETLESWGREAVEAIFGDEPIFNLRWDLSDDKDDVEYELILTLKRGPRKS